MARQFVRSVLITISLTAVIYLINKSSDEKAYLGEDIKKNDEGYDQSIDGENSPPPMCSNTTGVPLTDAYIWDINWDGSKIYENLPDKCIILIRHGQYTFATGQLTEIGKKQAELTGKRLVQMNYVIDKIVYSTMDRAVETAQLLQQQLQQPSVKMESDPILVEGGPIPPNPEIKYWSLPAKDYLVNGPRLEAAFKKYFHRPRTAPPPRTCTVLVGHGNIFRSFILRSLQLPVYAWMRFFIAHASISLVSLRSDGTNSLSLIGDAGHLPYAYVTY